MQTPEELLTLSYDRYPQYPETIVENPESFGYHVSKNIQEKYQDDRVRTNKTWNHRENLYNMDEIFGEIPKGAHLHLHFNAELHPSELLLQARKEMSDRQQEGKGAWARFNEATHNLKKFMSYEQWYRDYMARSIDRMVDEAKIYGGLKPILVEKPIDSKNGKLGSHNGASSQIFEVPSTIESGGNTHVTSALADYCAKYNFMNAKYARENGFLIDSGNVNQVTIGSGKKVATVGTTEAMFRFQGEQDCPYKLTFHVLPSCIHNVILGKAFLKVTRTLSSAQNFARRVTTKLLKGMTRRLLYLGSAPTFTGLLNGRPSDALADSGSSVLVMDEDYAASLGLPIYRGHKVRLLFADGSAAYTSGITRNVKWQFGLGGENDEHFLDFHVLKNAPAQVILSDTFLYETQAYSKYECYLMDIDDDEADIEEDPYDDECFFFTISYDPSFYGNGGIDMSTIANMEYAEASLRSQKEDAIATLPQADQASAWTEECDRREKWKQAMERLKQTRLTGAQTFTTQQNGSNPAGSNVSSRLPNANSPPRPPSNVTASRISSVSGAMSSQSPGAPNKRSRLRFKLRRVQD